jgi:hypothetical protein
VKFDEQKNKIDTENSWCDNIELFIDYGAWYQKWLEDGIFFLWSFIYSTPVLRIPSFYQ